LNTSDESEVVALEREGKIMKKKMDAQKTTLKI